MIKNLFQGIGYFIRGLRLITQPGIKRYVIIPLLINIVLFGALMTFGYDQFMDLVNWLAPAEDSWLSWLRWVLIPIFFIFALVVAFFTFTLVANLIGAPFNSLLAAAVEQHLTGTKLANGNGGWKQLLANIIPAMVSELKKMLYYLFIMFPFILLFVIAFFIPLLNVIASIAWMLVTAWVLAVEYTDYPMDNHKVDFRDLRKRLGQRRFMAYGFGGSVMFAMAIPVLNFFVMPVSVAGATAMAVEKLKD